MGNAEGIDYSTVNTANKWKILRTHWRYAWWGKSLAYLL